MSGSLASRPPGGRSASSTSAYAAAFTHPFFKHVLLVGYGRVGRHVADAAFLRALVEHGTDDCLRVLTREAEPKPFLDAMQHIHAWTAAFDYEDLDKVIAQMQACNAFDKSRRLHRLLFPERAGRALKRR